MGCAACALLARGCLARCVSPDPNPTSGTDVYTDDSDLVAVLVHTGHVKLKTVGKTPLLVDSSRGNSSSAQYFFFKQCS